MSLVQEMLSKLKFKRIGSRDHLIVVGIGDTSFKSEDKGIFLFLANSKKTRATPIYWKAKTIERVCHSSKDRETLNILRMVDDALFASRQLIVLFFGNYKGRIKVKLFMDLEATLEYINSLKQLDRKTLRMTVVDLKERLLDGDVTSYTWLPTERMWADILTKEKRLPPYLEDVFLEKIMDLPETNINKVKVIRTEK